MATFSHISGDTMLDLINTVEWRLGGPTREEDLTTYDLVLTWCRESGLLTDDEHAALEALAAEHPQTGERERQVVVQVREAAYAALFEHDDQAAQRLAALHRESLRRAHLVSDGARWVWQDRELGLRSPRDRIVLGLTVLLAREDLDRLHQCGDDTCGWVFLDTSPRRNRRWCVAADCGDRNRARAYYARHNQRVSAR